ncbi:MAG: DUF1059 domain-containing protein [Archaeoglobaceae archaeon]
MKMEGLSFEDVIRQRELMMYAAKCNQCGFESRGSFKSEVISVMMEHLKEVHGRDLIPAKISREVEELPKI